MSADLARFDVLHDALTAALKRSDWPTVRQLITDQLTADRGMQRTALIVMKQSQHLPEVADVCTELAAALRSTSTHGVI